MSKSQNTKNEQQKDLCITSEQLTEQWKKGELPSGEYWVKYIYGDIERLDYFWKTFNDNGYPINKETVAEVLAPVPTFDELQNINKAVNECMAANIKLVEQNAQLKEDFKRMKKLLQKMEESDNAREKFQNEQIEKLKELLKELRMSVMFDKDLITKIDEVLND